MIPLVLATGTIDVDTAIMVGGGALGLLFTIIGTLVNVIHKSHMKKIEELSSDIRSVREDITLLNKHLEEEKIMRQNKHESFAERIYTDIEKYKEKVNDINETVASFGSVYIGRSEFQEFQHHLDAIKSKEKS